MSAVRRVEVLIAALFLAAAAQAHEPDVTRLPIGDSKKSDAPKVGWLWACRIEGGRGPLVTGPWIKADGTYDLTAKPTIAGAATWPHSFTVTVAEGRRVFASNDLPNHPTGVFPVAPDDPARRYDRNPNRITPQQVMFSLPAEPAPASAPQCAPGAIGILLTGAVLFNGFDADGRDAVAHELQDKCQGHPQMTGTYHYHNVTSCLDDKTLPDGHSTLVGYAIDGFGIYGRRGEGGMVLSSADLDPCHGHTHKIAWNGKTVEMYHYHGTQDFPYTVGCLRGAYDFRTVAALSGGPPGAMGAPGRAGPPARDLSAVAAKLGIPEDRLRAALGPPPPDIRGAAAKLGISEQALRDAMGPPPQPPR